MADDTIKYSDLFPDDGGIDALIKKINELESTYKKVTNLIVTQTKKLKKETESLNVSDDKSNDILQKKEKELEKLTKQMEELGDAEEDVVAQKKKALKIAKEEQKLIEKRNSLTTDAAKKNAVLKVEISELNKELKQSARESKGLVGEYEKQSKSLNTLRKRYKDLAAAGEENSEEAQKLLVEVNALDKKLKDIDKSVGQSQRNVGNYGDSMQEAAEETAGLSESMVGAIDSSGVLGEITSKLGVIVAFLSKQKKKLNAETEESIVVIEGESVATKKAAKNQLLFSKSVNTSRRSVSKFNKVLKASVIGLIIVALGSLVSVLTKTQEGLVKLRAAGLAASGIMGVLTTRLIEVSTAFIALGKLSLLPIRIMINGFKAIGTQAVLLKEQISNAFSFGDASEKSLAAAQKSADEAATDFTKTFTDIPSQVETAFTGIADLFDGLFDDINKVVKAATPLSELLFDIELANAKRSKTQAELLAQSEKLEEIEGDATKSFKEREEAIKGSIEAQKEAAKLGVEIAEEKLRAFEEETAFQLQGKAETDAIAIERIEFEKEVLEAKKEASIKGLQLIRVQNQLEQDLIEKNLDIIIDGFDNQKTINEQLISDEKKRFTERQDKLDETVKLQKDALAEEVKEIQKKAKKEIDIDKLLAISDSKVLNNKIRLLGLSEILEGRLLEVVRDNKTATRDLDQAQIDLNENRISFLKEVIQATEDLKVANESNLESQAKLEEEYRFNRINDELEAQLKVAKGDEELTKELLLKKEQLNIEHDKKVAQNRIDAFVLTNDREAKELEISLLEAGETDKEISAKLRDDKIKDLEAEIKLKQELNVDALDDELELARLRAQKEKEIEEEKFKDLAGLRDSFINGTLDGIDKVLQKRIDANQKEQDEIKDQISKQEELAKEGLTNTLAFEEAELAKSEQKKIELEKQRVRVEEIKALYSAYSAAASSGDTNAITTALRDFAILRATSAAVSAFGDGTGEHGTISDTIDAKKGGSKGGNSLMNGIFKGKKHDSKGRGGIKVLVEGNEGIWKGSTMNKFGKDNFIALTKGIDDGSIGSDVFGKQISMIPQTNVLSMNLDSLEGKLDNVQKAIENKPVPSLHAESISESISDIVHTVQTGNKTVRSRYRLNKKRL
jgi:hypothetical protein